MCYEYFLEVQLWQVVGGMCENGACALWTIGKQPGLGTSGCTKRKDRGLLMFAFVISGEGEEPIATTNSASFQKKPMSKF